MSVLGGNPLLMTPEGYQISRSVRLRSSASGYFNKTFASAGNQQKFTWSGWVKRGSLTSYQDLFSPSGASPNQKQFYFNNTDNLQLYHQTSSTVNINLVTTQVFRDCSGWYHVVLVVDTTQATASDRVKFYVNGVQVTSFSTATYPTQNFSLVWNSATAHYIGRNNAFNFDGYLTEINFIDGQALTPSSFGETDAVTGVWKPKKYTGTYGTNGFYLNFSDNSNNTAATIGKDSSGNGNNWTPNNISVTAGVTYDSMLDVPTPYADGDNGRGNYAILNPLDFGANGVKSIITQGNLKGADAGSGTYNSTSVSSIGVTSGKFYCEFTSITAFVQAGILYGLPTSDITAAGIRYYGSNGIIYKDGVSQGTFSTYTTNDVIGLALNADAKTIAFYKNNTLITTITYTSTNTVYLGALYPNTAGGGIYANFGQRPFTYTPPTGFKALNTQNLDDSTIKKGNQYFDVQTWSGDGVNGRTITSTVDTVDLAWVKKRNGIDDHRIANSVLGGNKHLKSNATDAESTGTTVIQAFSGSTFTVGSDNSVNASGGTYVGWTWKESVSSGFDIVTYTGDGTTNRTVAHSLGVQPSMFIIKARSAATTSWMVHHKDLGNNGGSPAYLQYLQLESTAAKAASTSLLPVVGLSSTTFPTSGATNNTNVNGNGTTYVAYLFSEVAGFSKFGSYTGNGSSDGPFVYCGFRPRYILCKNASAVTDWWIVDTARDTYNVANLGLKANGSSVEIANTYSDFDILSNGFKVRRTSSEINGSGNTIIYAAFAENPFKNSLAR